MAGRWIVWAAIGAAMTGGAMALQACATMSKDQCLAGDWGGQGFRDGDAGRTRDRLEEHAKACAKHGVLPDEVAYLSGREDGLSRYCTWERGFEEGRRGNGYARVCPVASEAEFLPAYGDGRSLYVAEQDASNADSEADRLDSRLDDLNDRIDATRKELDAEGLTDDQKRAVRDRLAALRHEREETERDWRRAADAAEDAEERASDLRFALRERYGSRV